MIEPISTHQKLIIEFANKLKISLDPWHISGQDLHPVLIVAYSFFHDNLALYEFRHIVNNDGFGKQYFGIVYRKDLTLEILDEGTSLTEAMEIIREQRLNERADIEEQNYYRQRDWEQECFDNEHFLSPVIT